MSGQRIRARLRVLATSDLHMHLLPFDYFAQRPALGLGLQGVAALIARHRAECGNCLLLDNGDFLQGNPLGDWLAQNPQEIHPMIEAMNRLGYDAVTLGNHDFNFGLRFLRQALAGARFPIVTSNARLPLRSSRTLLLRREFLCDDGVSRPVAIGVIGVMPPQTTQWDAALALRMEVEDILAAAQQAVASLRAQGADLIVALAHSGISACSDAPFQENAATALAALDGIDGVISGHTHLVFPGPGHPDDRLIDAKNGRLAGKPVVMPGFWGSHLGVIEYEIEGTASGWQIVTSSSRAEPVALAQGTVSGLSASVAAVAQRPHVAALRDLNRRIGRIETPLHSYFSYCGADAGMRLVAMTQRWHLRKMLARDARWRDLPILSAVAPFRSGGRGGPDHFTDVPAGPLFASPSGRSLSVSEPHDGH